MSMLSPRGACLHVFYSVCLECFVSLNFLYGKLHYKRCVSVLVTKLPFRFTASLNKIVLILHRNVVFFIRRSYFLSVDTLFH